MEALVTWLGGESAITRAVLVGMLVAARVAPLTILAPWLAVRQAPAMLRTAVVLALTFALTPLAMQSAPEIPESPTIVAALALREAMVGAVFAIATALPMHALEWAGSLVDTWRGSNLAEILAPPTGTRTSPMGTLYVMMGVVLFIAVGGHRVALEALADGLAEVPVGTGQILAPDVIAFGAARIFGQALSFAAVLAAPAAVAIVLVEVALGLVARASPQVPVFFAGMPLRAATGLGAALLGLALLVDRLPAAMRGAIDTAADLVLRFAR